jgi:hypothetical protein
MNVSFSACGGGPVQAGMINRLNAMKNSIARILSALAVCCCLGGAVLAQTTEFTYQGRLTDGAGPASGSYDLCFALYDDINAGTQQGGAVTNSATTVSNGLFTVALDFGNQFSGANRWLEIAVQTNGGAGFTTLTPRQALTPTPYAITAGSVVSGGLETGTYGNAVTLDNADNNITGVFMGDGSGLTGVNADSLNGLTSASFWQISGNAGANPTNGAFIGTTDNLPLEFKVNGNRALRFEYTYDFATSNAVPNIIGGYAGNIVSNGAVGAVIAGGGRATAANRVGRNGHYSMVLGGIGNVANDAWSVVGGANSTVNGVGNVAIGLSTTTYGEGCVAMGEHTTASNFWATALGGYSISSGVGAAAIGFGNIASGDGSTAMGDDAQAAHDHSFVWSDGAGFSSTAANQFMVHAAGGLQLFGGGLAVSGSSSPNYARDQGVFIESQGTYGSIFAYDYINGNTLPLRLNAPGGNVGVGTVAPTHLFQVGNAYCDGNTWAPSSDRNLKAGFEEVDAQAVLAKVAALPITSWHYTNAVATPHLGPMAQDFYAAFNVGADDKHITTTDESGVALAAIQGLNEKVESGKQKVETQMEQLAAENVELKQRLVALEEIMLNQKPN